MYCYKLILAYDGTRFGGWQIQPNALSIQQILQDAVRTVLREKDIGVIGSGRTDAGVHASAQVAHFKSEQKVDLQKLHYSLNGILPSDIRVKIVEEVPLNFHARYSAIAKEYHYHLYLDRVMDPFRRLYCWQIFKRCDVELLKKAATLFVGTHDFTSFANERHGEDVCIDKNRTLTKCAVCPEEGGVRLEFKGNGFLYKMVRNIVGTLVDVATLRLTCDEVISIFEAKDRRCAGMAAPPQGLFLVRVEYDFSKLKLRESND